MADRKKKHIGLWVTGILFLLSAVLFFAIAYSVAAEIPRVLEYDRSSLSNGLTFRSYERLPNIYYKDELAVSGELKPVKVENIGEVKPVLVNEHFFEIYHIHVGGSGITAEQVNNKTRAVVISDKAALSLSLDGDVIGRTITLYGKDYTVVGIYQQPKGFLRESASDIFDRVYIPYTCYEGYADVPIDSFAAPKGVYSEKSIPLLGMTKSDTSFYIENDLVVKNEMIANFPHLFIAVIALAFAVFAFKMITRMTRRAYQKLHEDAQNDYGKKVLQKNWLYLLSRVLLSLLLIAVPVTLWILFTPRLVLPPNYIPYDNIFDIKHYIEALIEHMQMTNAGIISGNRYFQCLCDHSVLILSILLCVLIVLMIVIRNQVKRLIRERNNR